MTTVYVLIEDGGAYSDQWHRVHGAYSTLEKAKAAAERLVIEGEGRSAWETDFPESNDWVLSTNKPGHDFYIYPTTYTVSPFVIDEGKD